MMLAYDLFTSSANSIGISSVLLRCAVKSLEPIFKTSAVLSKAFSNMRISVISLPMSQRIFIPSFIFSLNTILLAANEEKNKSLISKPA